MTRTAVGGRKEGNAAPMQIELAYGRHGANITVPDENLVAVVNPDWPTVIARPEAAVTESLRHPAAGPPLALQTGR